MKKGVNGHASVDFCSLLMQASCSRLSRTIFLMHMRTLTTLRFISRSSQTVQWVKRKQARGAMERCIRAVRVWLIVDKLKLNKDKSEFKLIGTRQQLSKVRTYSLMVGDTQAKSVSEARNLGVWFDPNLQFRSHINKTCQLAFFLLYNIRRIRKYLPYEAAKS